MYNRFYHTIIFLFVFGVSLIGQNPDSLVWPGDINNNGIVNHIDLLFLGKSYGSVGMERDSTEDSWVGMPTPDNWVPAFNNIIPSVAFADCNGDGTVDQSDFNAIEQNYGQTHDMIFPDEFAKIPGAFGEMYFPLENENLFISEGGTYSLDLNLGSESSPMENIYGYAFTLVVNPDYINIDDLEFIPADSWLYPNLDNIIQITKTNNNMLEVALSRTDQATQSGSGPIGTVGFVIEDNFTNVNDVEIIQLEHVYVVDDNLNSYQQVYGGSLVADFDKTSPISDVRPNDFRIFPNPSRTGVFDMNRWSSDYELFISDITGRKQLVKSINGELDLSNYANGIYFLEVRTLKGNWTEKIIIQQ